MVRIDKFGRKKVQTGFVLPESLIQIYRHFAIDHCMSLSELAEVAIRDYITRQKKIESVVADSIKS